MGSCRPSDLLTKPEAAALLGMPKEMLDKLVRQGFLNPVGLSKYSRRYRLLRSEVNKVRMMLDQGRCTTDYLDAVVVLQARVARLEQRQEYLETLLGLHSEPLPTKRGPVLALYQLVKNSCKSLNRKPEDIFRWAKLFISITEEFLELLGRYANDERPWKPFVVLADRVVEDIHVGVLPMRPDLNAAYQLIIPARAQLKRTAYFYIRERYGLAQAALDIPDDGEPNRMEEIAKIALGL